MATQEVTLEHGLPVSIESERTILGAILLDNSAYHEAAEGLQVSDFALDSHRKIFGAMTAVLEDGFQINVITLSEELDRRSELDGTGGRPYLFSLTENLPRRINISDFLRIVKEKSQLRQLMLLYQHAVNRITDGSQEAQDIAGDVQQGSLEIQATDRNSGVLSAMEILPSAMQAVLDPQKNSANILPTPVGALNDMLCGGIRRGEMTTFGALANRGKSPFARQMGAITAKRGIATLIVTPEMTKEQCLTLIVAAECGVDTMRLRKTEYLNAVDRQRLTNSAREVGTWPLYVEDTSSLHIAKLLAKAKLAVIRHGVQLVIVDYLQRIYGPGQKRNEVIGNIAQKLADFAKAENVAVLLLSQLTPDGKDQNAKPHMGWLRESHDIENHSHAVILLHRPKEDGQWTGNDLLILDKQRNGLVGDIPVEFVGSLQVFRDRKTERDA